MTDAGTARSRLDETTERISALRELLARRQARGILLGSRRDFAWVTTGGQNHVVLSTEAGVAPLLVTERDVFVFAPTNEAARIAEEEVSGLPIELIEVPWEDSGAIEREARARAGSGLLDANDMADDLTLLRARLSAFDHERLRALGAAASDAMAAALARVDVGSTEDQLAADVVATLAATGIRAPVVLVAADERIERYRHPIPGGAPIQRRVMLVIVAERWGLHVAATRFRELEPPSAELARLAEATGRVLEALLGATRTGSMLGEAFDAARTAYEREGYAEEWRLHHQGGLIGYAGRERIATPGDQTAIEAGMAFAWNPSITGTKAEQTFILHEDGSRETVLE